MPELPEVETMRRGVLPAVGSIIRQVTAPRSRRLRPIAIEPRPATLARRVEGRAIVAAERAGKRVLLALEGDDRLVFEPRMTGLLLVADPPDDEHLRLHLELDGPLKRISYWDRRGLGSVRLLSPAQLAERLGPRSLGPDALTIDAALLRAALGLSRRAIKVALLDQRAIAGVGNLYASELLFVAGVHPAARCDRLTRGQWERIAAALRQVLLEAIEHEGSTLSDGTYRNALNKAGGYQNMHRVYDRAGQPCPRCGAGVVRIVQAQRSTFLCRFCQRR